MFIYSSADGYLGCFQDFAIINKAATFVCKSLGNSLIISYKITYVLTIHINFINN